LASYLAHRQWEKAIQILSTNEGRVMTNDADRHGRYPIHQALLLGAPATVISALIRANETHALLSCANKTGEIPIHMCLEPHDAVSDDFRPDDEVFYALFRGFEEASKIRNTQKRLPLELALRHHASDEIISALVDAFPPAVRDIHQNTEDILCLAIQCDASLPVLMKLTEILCNTGGIEIDVLNATDENFQRLRFAMEHNAPDDFILLLIQQPHATLLNQRNDSLLHIALRHKYSENVVLAIIDKCPMATKVPDGTRYLLCLVPLFFSKKNSNWFHSLLSSIFSSVALGYMPLHRALVHKSSDKVLLRLIQGNPEAAISPIENKMGGPNLMPLTVAFQTKRSGQVISAIMDADQRNMLTIVDDNGDLPIHQAIKLGAPDDTILAVLHGWVDAAKSKDKSGYLPLHLAVKHASSASAIVGIVQAWPEATQHVDKNGDLPLHQALNFAAPPEAVLEILNAWTVAAMLKNQENDKLPIHYAVLRKTDPRVVDALLRVYPQALDVKFTDETTGKTFTARDRVSHSMPEESIRMIMKPVSYWERIVSNDGGKDMETLSFDALSAVVDELESKFRHGQEKEQLLLEKIKILEEKLKRLSANMTTYGNNTTPPLVVANGIPDLLDGEKL
jgi:hypothetical protein